MSQCPRDQIVVKFGEAVDVGLLKTQTDETKYVLGSDATN